MSHTLTPLATCRLTRSSRVILGMAGVGQGPKAEWLAGPGLWLGPEDCAGRHGPVPGVPGAQGSLWFTSDSGHSGCQKANGLQEQAWSKEARLGAVGGSG